MCAEEENRRSFSEEKRKSVRMSTRRSKLWTTTGARPDLEEIYADPQYKPKFTISSFFSSHNVSSPTPTASASRRPVVPDDQQTPTRPIIYDDRSIPTWRELPTATPAGRSRGALVLRTWGWQSLLSAPRRFRRPTKYLKWMKGRNTV